MSDDLAQLEFPTSDEEAASRFARFEHFDPFSQTIPPALLNSTDIFEYVRVTGMVHPFSGVSQDKLKPASYEIDFLGSVLYWKDEEKTDYTKVKITLDKPFEIPKNSIVFISPEITFRLPDYIAIRFNLRIKHVHRGLLLGTGPLVDPGFAGRLFIPLHNLTSESYVITGGEGLIWVEFTKISPHQHWVKPEKERGGYIHFPERGRYRTPQQYLNKCSPNGKPARSSIPIEVDQAKKLSSQAMEEAEQTIKQINEFESRIKKWNALGLIVGAFGIMLPIHSLVSDVNNYVRSSGDSVAVIQRANDKQKKDISDLKKRIEALEMEVTKNPPPKQLLK